MSGLVASQRSLFIEFENKIGKRQPNYTGGFANVTAVWNTPVSISIAKARLQTTQGQCPNFMKRKEWSRFKFGHLPRNSVHLSSTLVAT